MTSPAMHPRIEEEASSGRGGRPKFLAAPANSGKAGGQLANSSKSSKSNKSTKSSMSTKSRKSEGHQAWSSEGRDEDSGGEKKRAEMAKPESVLIPCKGEGHRVDLNKFSALSDVIKKEREMYKLGKMVMDHFEKETVEILAGYIDNNNRQTNISFCTLLELLKVANGLAMPGLQKQLEAYLLEVVDAARVEQLIQCLLVLSLTTVSVHTESHILTKAAARLVDIATAPDFQTIPFRSLSTLLGRCDLAVQNELVLVDITLLWLAGQPPSTSYTTGAFAFVRSHLLHAAEKEAILGRAVALGFTAENTAVVVRELESGHGSRVCTGHAVGPRCGSETPCPTPLLSSCQLYGPSSRHSKDNLSQSKSSKSSSKASSMSPSASNKSKAASTIDYRMVGTVFTVLLFCVSLVVVSSQCVDNNSNCAFWNANGFCRNPSYTQQQKTALCCATCAATPATAATPDPTSCADFFPRCAIYAAGGFCQNAIYDSVKRYYCGKTCGERQRS